MTLKDIILNKTNTGQFYLHDILMTNQTQTKYDTLYFGGLLNHCGW